MSGDVIRHNGADVVSREYAYKAISGTPSNVLNRITYDNANYNRSFMINRDANGNIHYSLEGTDINTYEYDSANQLIRENNRASSITSIWTYDAAGNILTRETYPYNTGTLDPAKRLSLVNYTYDDDKGWGDLLTAYNGVPITHDEIGNPLNDGTWTYTWQHGRQLASMAKIDQSESWQFTYNADGMRTQRTGSVTDPTTGVTTNRTYNYTYLGGQLTHMSVGEHTMYFAYDASGVPLSMTYNGVNYYYVTNLQGDVVAILNASGAEVVRYIYDAWGNLISTTGTQATTIGFYNPLRYRGYVYDAETGLYYLQSRYYNPEMGRFINADGLYDTNQGILGHNMYAYCLNNPVNAYDPDGKCIRLGYATIDCKDSTCITSDYYPKPKSIKPYNNGRGYVGFVTSDHLDAVMANKPDNMVVILDLRTTPKIDMQIQDSYKIKKKAHQQEIAQLMIDYNTAYPVVPAWKRTKDSIVKEWRIHNNVYYAHLFRSNTADCNFNNGDEGKGYWDFFCERVLNEE